jgi:hypothetical protein
MGTMLAQDGALPVRSTLALNQEHILRRPQIGRLRPILCSLNAKIWLIAHMGVAIVSGTTSRRQCRSSLTGHLFAADIMLLLLA